MFSNRQNFDLLLLELKEKLYEMSDTVERILQDSVESLKAQDLELAESVIKLDSIVDNLEIEINNFAIRLIATQQPVAKDLRKIISAIKIANDLERIADLSVNIAKVTRKIHGQKLIKPLIDIPKMTDHTLKMLRLCIDSYIKEDIELAKQLDGLDDVIDKGYKSILNELLNYMIKDSRNVDQGQLLGLVARYIERIADHTTNIGESVIYLVSGERSDLNK
ncbi:MAG: phosphate signaling complex protein PhoU [Vulcanibacillus sp.]